jgi:acetolactate synthase I/II/III large subunit
MTGAECLLRTLVANCVTTCFMNPGTSEMHFVSALDRVPGMRGVLCLYEGVCSGAADGYARMKGEPASVLLHLGPGLANALSNLHNARKARMPVLAIVGEHSTPHLKFDAPLSADIAAFARAVSSQVRIVEDVDSIATLARDAIAAAFGPPGQVSTLIVPADCSWLDTQSAAPVFVRPERRAPSSAAIAAAARILRAGSPVGFILGGSSIMDDLALAAAGRIAAATGARFFADRSAPRVASGRGRFPVRRLPYFPQDAHAALAGLGHMLLVEAAPPVSFFGYPDTPSSPVPETCVVSALASRDEDGAVALALLAAELEAHAMEPVSSEAPAAPTEDGPLSLDAIGRTVAAMMPEGAIVSDGMVSSREPVLNHLHRALPHDQMAVTGGAIGQGLPVAIGAAIACPDRRVVSLEGDGSAMYSFQSLWTMARERLDIIVVIFANRRYRILDIEMARTGASGVGKRANDMVDIGSPNLDFVSLARGVGVPATRAVTILEFGAQLRSALAGRGPRLIEAVL